MVEAARRELCSGPTAGITGRGSKLSNFIVAVPEQHRMKAADRSNNGLLVQHFDELLDAQARVSNQTADCPAFQRLVAVNRY